MNVNEIKLMREELEKIAEKVFVDKANLTIRELTDRQKQFLKEQTAMELDKKNAEIEREYPEYGAVALVMDGGTELSFPFNSDSVIKIIDGDKITEFVVDGKISIKDIIDAINGCSSDTVGIETYTTKELEFYDKDKLYNDEEKIKYAKTYKKTFSAFYPKRKVCAVYKVAGTLE